MNSKSATASTSMDDVYGRWSYSWPEREKILELTFPMEEYELRCQKLYAAMERASLDTLIVHGGPGNYSNVRYLTGWGSHIGETLVMMSRRHDPILITNNTFHGEPMHSGIQTCWVRDFRAFMRAPLRSQQKKVVECLAGALREIGAETGKIGLATPGLPPGMNDDLRHSLGSVEFVNANAMLLDLRSIKSAHEIQKIRVLNKAVTASMDAALAHCVPGQSENDVAAAATAALIAAGGQVLRGPYVQSGVRSALKNVYALPGKVIKEGEIVSIDLISGLDGYHSDHHRCTVAGTPSAEQIHLLETCIEAEEAGIRATGPGVRVGEVVRVMTDIIKARGYEEWDWSLGHGFGMEFSEAPFFGDEGDTVLQAGHTFFIEPMILPTHMGCACFEDPILVTDNGAECLTTTRRRAWLGA